MSGTTLCPNCNTRFRITLEQLEAHHGMVRCGQCLQAFDARPGYIPDQPSPQLELTILDEPIAPEGERPPGEPVIAAASGEAEPAGEAVLDEMAEKTASAAESPKIDFDSLPDFDHPAAAGQHDTAPPEMPQAADEPAVPTLAEQVVIVQDEEEGDGEPRAGYRRWPWAAGVFLLLLVMLAQAAYFFRIDLAARLPGLKPALAGYCRLLGCSVPLPQKTDLMSIESSDLEAEPANGNQITLNALLRNRAPYALAFPHLELSLNDTQDKPLARRSFTPKDYLPPHENEQAGLLPNHEFVVKLRLDTADLRPTGYRLVLYYPKQ